MKKQQTSFRIDFPGKARNTMGKRDKLFGQRCAILIFDVIVYYMLSKLNIKKSNTPFDKLRVTTECHGELVEP